MRRYRYLALAVTLAAVVWAAADALGFALVDFEGDGDLADLIERPAQFLRFEKGTIRWKMDDEFRDAWTDPYARYLVRETMRDLAAEAFAFIQYGAGAPPHAYRQSTDEAAILDLRSVLLHEVGHALGLQHPDAAAYNTSQENPPAPYGLNWRLDPYLQPMTADTFGTELMNEGYSDTPGQKGPKGIADGQYNRVLGWDDSMALIYAYGGDFPNLVEVGADDAADLVLGAYSNPDSSNLGQGGADSWERIDEDDVSDGWKILTSSLVLNAGKPIAYNTRKRLFSYVNPQAEELQEIRLMIRGTSTDEPVSASSSGAHAFQQGVRVAQDPDFELAAYVFSEPQGGGVPTGAQVDFDLELDVDDWVLEGATAVTEAGEVEIPFVDLEPVVPPAEGGLAGSAGEGLPGGLLPADPGPPGGLQQPLDRRPADRRAPSEPSVRITAPRDRAVEVGEIELFALELDYVVNGGRVDAAYLDRLAVGGGRRSLAFDRQLLPGETVELRLADLEPDTIRRTTDADPDRSIVGPVAIRVTTSNEVGVLQITTLAGVPQGLPTLDALCGAYGTAGGCCGSSRRSVSLGDADDALSAATGECVTTGGGHDVVVSAAGVGEVQRVALGDGDDTFQGGAGLARAFGGDGDDLLVADPRGVLVADGGAGDDLLSGAEAGDTLRGGPGADEILGGGGEDILEGGSGADVIFGGSGDDEIFPGAGADRVRGGEGDDRVVLSACADDAAKVLNGGPGVDVLVVPSTVEAVRKSGTVIRGFERIVEGGSFGDQPCEPAEMPASGRR